MSTRRQLLTVITSSAVGAVAGCFGSESDDEGGEVEGDGSPVGTRRVAVDDAGEPVVEDGDTVESVRDGAATPEGAIKEMYSAIGIAGMERAARYIHPDIRDDVVSRSSGNTEFDVVAVERVSPERGALLNHVLIRNGQFSEREVLTEDRFFDWLREEATRDPSLGDPDSAVSRFRSETWAKRTQELTDIGDRSVAQSSTDDWAVVIAVLDFRSTNESGEGADQISQFPVLAVQDRESGRWYYYAGG